MSAPRNRNYVNPYPPDTEKHGLFEAAWSKKSNRTLLRIRNEAGRKEREARLQRRVDSFVEHRDAFVAHHGLALQPQYHSERDDKKHRYPGGDEPVRYLDRSTNERQAFAISFEDGRVREGALRNLEGNPFDPAKAGRDAMFTRRHSNAGSLLAIMPSTTSERTHHSTFNAGLEVANAGFIDFDQKGKVQSFRLTSGHYAPDAESGVKMAMWSERHGVFDPGKAVIWDHWGDSVDTSIQQRMSTVHRWAKREAKKTE